jgi:hypothetical protein
VAGEKAEGVQTPLQQQYLSLKLVVKDLIEELDGVSEVQQGDRGGADFQGQGILL